ncbi:MAG: helix-turn-helix domain-containing protein [Trebonia sp.]|uniref:helix-turn-helix domain-containing protein n=2 Tax=Trebonia sp. TaxID=2767075 RepID=UPI003C74729E
MSVGEALAEARSRAGLSVDELSERTKIRGTVIRCIEQDDYDACGGDVFVRGYVRALASAVGIDARPLIREYDQARTDTSGDTFAHVARVAHPVPPSGPDVTAADVPVAAAGSADTSDATAADLRLPAVHTASPSSPSGPADPDFTSADLPAVSADPAVTVFDLPVVTEDPAPTVDDLPVIPPEPAGPPVRRGDLPGSWTPVPPPARGRRHTKSRDRRRVARVAVPVVLVLAAAGVASGLALSSQSAPTGKSAAAVTQPSSHTAHAPLTSKPATPASAAPAPSATAPAPAQPAVTALHIASAAGFGPGGLADGDNSRVASNAITRGAQAPWQSQWYATAQFGNLKQGTGLLLDLGRTATITSVRIDLASYQGANLQLRVGDTDGALSSLRVAATADDVGGTVRLHLRSPQQARYVLIWFTLLPPNGAGQYQASVYHVVVNGRP